MHTFDKLAWMYNIVRGNGQREYNLIKQIVHLDPTDRVLDVGGGTGLIASRLANDVQEVIVIDPAQKMLDKIKDKRIKTKLGSAQNLPFQTAEFDVLCVVDALHHFSNGFSQKDGEQQIRLALHEALRVLKPDGRLIIVEFNPVTILGRLIQLFENKLMRFGSILYTPEQLQQLFSFQYSVTTVAADQFCYALRIVRSKV